MTSPKPNDPSANLAKVNPDLVLVAMIIGAAMMVFIGFMVPGWVQIEDPAATWMSIAFFVAAALEVCVAFYLRGVIRKAQATANPGSVIRRD